MSILETVRRICQDEAAKFLPGATVVAPLAVWDADNKFMGVQIKAQRRMGAQDCEVTAGFVLSPIELRTQELIRAKAVAAVACMIRDIQVSIRPVKSARERFKEHSPDMDSVHRGIVSAETGQPLQASMPMTDAQAEDITRRSA